MVRMTRMRWGATLVVISLATITTLSARGRDNNSRFIGFQSCDDINEDPSGPQWSPSNCLEGHECVVCEDSDFGEEVDSSGTGVRMFAPDPFRCGGDRIIGVCTTNASGASSCDLSMSYADGRCGGVVNQYQKQAEPAPPPPGIAE